MDKIAIIGMGCLFPGAQTVAQFWQNLLSGNQTFSPATAEQLGVSAEAFFDSHKRKADTSYFLQGGYIRDFVFDPTGYLLPSEYLETLGNASLWSLYVAQSALTDSGYANDADLLRRTGVIMGNLSFPTMHSNHLFSPIYSETIGRAISDVLDTHLTLPIMPHHNQPKPENALSSGYVTAVMASALGLGGTHFALDAACGSSLYAVGLACKYLRAGKADLMLAGAVSAADPLFVNLGFAHLGGYPDEGKTSKPLDENSDGLVSGEGAGAFVLKRYDDALRDNDHIYAVVSGVGMSNDGRGKHILTPNPKGQIIALERAYERAEVSPADIQYVECHASGTSVGDRTELLSMETFFGRYNHTPLMGSVKSNVGHLLTASGMVSMMKVILSMAHDHIPETVGVTHPLNPPNGHFESGKIVAQARAWKEEHKRAGVNAFGFGGVSTHIILESNGKQHKPMQNLKTEQNLTPLAIIGMDAHFGTFENLEDFARAIYTGETAINPLPETRWKGLQHQPELLQQFGLNSIPDGAYIEAFDLDFMKFRIPPNPVDEPIPQQLMMMKVADNAIRDAGMSEGANVAVIVAMGTELALHRLRGRADLNWQVKDALENANLQLSDDQRAELERISKNALLSTAEVNHYTSYIGNISANRVSSLWDFSGASFTVSAEENSVFKALEVAQLLLSNNEVDAVVVGAVDLAGGIENVLLRNAYAPIHQGKPTAGISDDSTGWLIGEGAGAVVLSRVESTAGKHIYATIDAVALAQATHPETPDTETLAQAIQTAHKLAGTTPQDIGYIELHSSGIDAEDLTEITALTQQYRGHDLTTAIGTVKANIGHTFAASGMASLIKTALTLSRRFLPEIPNWRTPKAPSAWEHTPFFVANKSRTWFSDHRKAAINGLGIDGTAAHLILSSVMNETQDTEFIKHQSPYLLLIAGQDKAHLQSELSDLALVINSTQEGDLSALADRFFATYHTASNKTYTLAIVGRHLKELTQEIERAQEGIQTAFAQGNWSTPAGSYLTTNPVGKDGKIAFVYPGAFNSYPKLGYDIFQLFPRTYANLQQVKSDVGEAVAEHRLYSRSLEKPSVKQTRLMKEALAHDAVAMIESGLSFAVIYTRIMRDYFNIHPDSAFGYSLGEGSMMWGMGIWQDGNAGSAGLHNSNLFDNRLVGEMDAIREAWGIPNNIPADEMWAAYFIAAPLETVRDAVNRESKVYLTHINTPNEVMIAGDPSACERVVEAVGGDTMKAPFSVVIHNEAMMSEFGEYYRLHHLPVTPINENITFYSAADYAPITLDKSVIANSIARMACKQIDFPRLVNQAYADGARVFIELGPRSTCARWIDETLGEQAHIAVSIDNLGTNDRTSIVKMLAQLVSHGVQMDLSSLFAPLPAPNGRSLFRSVRLGGENIYETIVNDKAFAKFDVSEQTMTNNNLPKATQAKPAATHASPSDVSSNPSSTAHMTFLETRQSSLRQLGEMLEMQFGAISTGNVPTMSSAPAPVSATPTLPLPPAPTPAPAPSQAQGIEPLYNEYKINQFAIGRVANCYGDKYTIYDNTRAPRIPNGDLLLLSRAVDITGERFKSASGSTIHAEYDVPVDAWFYRDNVYPVMPYAVYMEIALQPSGFLSAHHGPTLKSPDIDFYFRNLDGYGTLLIDKDMRGRTITNYVKLLGSTGMQGIIIEKFSYEMYDGDEKFYEGEATFGYFTKEALDSQAGLDAGKLAPLWLDTVDLSQYEVINIDPKSEVGEGYLRLANGQLGFTNEIKVVPNGGKHGEGYAYANTIIDPDAWFFKNHFYQDPVMPGSIGVETIMQALQAYVITTGLADDFENPHFAQTDGMASGTEGHKISWRYRGQILSTSEKSHVEANIKRVERRGNQITLYADASLWRDKLRVYEINDVALTVTET